MLLACNHPNSFFDALILGSFFKQPVHFLARGDAFKNPLARKILSALNAIPIYRLKEGKEYLALNDNTFDRCLKILQSGGIVLIFSEGLCLNQWDLRPLKKGTARIAITAWKHPSIKDIFSVLPVSLNYSSFTRFSKTVIINFGNPIQHEHLLSGKNEAEQIVELNKIIYSHLEDGMLVERQNASVAELLLRNTQMFSASSSGNIPRLKFIQEKIYDRGVEKVFNRLAGSKKLSLRKGDQLINILFILLLFIPAIAGLSIHLPFYLPIKKLIRNKTNGTVFYHSALFGVLIIIYPFYLIILSIVGMIYFDNRLFILLLPVLPMLALIYLQWKESMESLCNYFKLSIEERKQLLFLFNENRVRQLSSCII